jgi:hypothetical protein
MKKQTKRINNKKRKTKTRKYYGGKNSLDKKNSHDKKDEKDVKDEKDEKDEKSKGIFDIIGNKLYHFTKNTGDFVAEKGLRLVGLQKIKKDSNDNDNTENVDSKVDELSDASTGAVSGILSSATQIASDVANVVDKSSAALVGQVNDVLESPKVENSVQEAADETLEISEKLLENVNEKLNDPVFKKEVEITLDNVGDYAEIAVDSLNEPLNKGMDSLNEAGTKAVAGVASGAIKVGTDALAAVPYLGAVVELGKVVNDGSKAIGEVVEAGADSVSTVSEIVKETSKNIHEGIEKLEEQKKGVEKNFKDLNKHGKKISSRIDKSLNDFENPFSSGGGKTRSKFSGNKIKKTKRVRFVI